MSEESLVGRLERMANTFHGSADASTQAPGLRRIFREHAQTCEEAVRKLRKAADALERAEKEGALLRGMLANLPDSLLLSSGEDHDRVAMLHETSLELITPPTEWFERVKHNLLTALLRTRSMYRALSPSPKDETP
jgi:hypothetical protein